jgi:hypothetical protein
LNGAQSDLIRAENMLAIAQIELNKAIVQLQSAVEGDSPGLSGHVIIKPAVMTAFDKLLQIMTEKFK